MFTFDGFWGMCGENSCNVFLLFFMVRWVPNFEMFHKEGSADIAACLHAPLAWACRVFPPFSFLIGGFHCSFL
jgi:hypothetical protein